MPTGHTKRDTLFELVEAAVHASADQRHAWAVSLDADEIRRFADRARALDVTDPGDRELTVSCGAALYNLRVVSRLHGLDATVADGGSADVPTVEVRPSAAPADRRLAEAVDLRRTHREGFRDEPVPEGLAQRLTAAVAEEGALAVVADEDLRVAVADLVAQGDRLHYAGGRWRRELASLVRPRRRGDGVAGPDPSVRPVRSGVSAFDVGARAARHDRELAMSAPLLVVIATAGDTSADWLRAGEGLEHLLLEAADAGLQGSYLNQPCQLPELRDRLRSLLPGAPFPQLIVRIGFPADAVAHREGDGS